MRISGQLGGHCLWVQSEQDGPSCLECERENSCAPILVLLFCLHKDEAAHKGIKKPHFWVLKRIATLWPELIFFFLKGHRDSHELALSHRGFSQRILFRFHYSWRLFSEGALNHAESTPVCLPQEEEREKVCAGRTQPKGLFSSARSKKVGGRQFEEKH